MRIAVSDDGRLLITDVAGRSLTPQQEAQARRHFAGAIAELLEESCASLNDLLDSIVKVHLPTPAPDHPVSFQAAPFSEPPPEAPALEDAGLLGALFQGRREAVERENARRRADHDLAQAAWQARRSAHDRAEAERRHRIEVERLVSIEAMEAFLEETLAAIDWPRETQVAYSLLDRSTLFLDVDLPELEALPTRLAAVARRGDGLTFKPLSETRRRKDYMAHVHGIGFRLIGEAFRALPKLRYVVLSAYTQRVSSATGHVEDDYLYSVAVDREDWGALNFGNLAAIDLVTCFEGFTLRRDMTKTGVFRPIVPFAVEELHFS